MSHPSAILYWVIACDCRSTGALCPRCVDDGAHQLGGVAECRGGEWAASVERRASAAMRAQPWPDDEKARAIAAKKVSDLTKDAGLLERLVDAVQHGAERRWREGVHRPYFAR